MRYLVDTDWVIDYQHRISRTVQLLDSFLSDGVGMSVVSLAELYEGHLALPDTQAQDRELQSFLASITVVPVDDAVCRLFARERRRLRIAGNLIGDLDILIGCTAIRHDLTLLTNNRRHFERLSGLNIISVTPLETDRP